MEGSHQKHRSWQAGPLPLPCPSPSPASISAPHWAGGNLRPSAPSTQRWARQVLAVPSSSPVEGRSPFPFPVPISLWLPYFFSHWAKALAHSAPCFYWPHTLKCAALNFTTWPFIHLSLSFSPSSLGSVSIFMTAFYNPEQTNADSVFLLISFALIISWSYNLCFLGEGGSWF